MGEDQEERCLGLFTSGGESRERVKAEGGSDKEGTLTCLLLVFVQLFEKEPTSGTIQVLRVEGSVSRYQWNLEIWGSRCKKSCWFRLERPTKEGVVLKRV